MIRHKDSIITTVNPEEQDHARRLLGTGCKFSPDRDAVAELVAERAAEG